MHVGLLVAENRRLKKREAAALATASSRCSPVKAKCRGRYFFFAAFFFVAFFFAAAFFFAIVVLLTETRGFTPWLPGSKRR